MGLMTSQQITLFLLMFVRVTAILYLLPVFGHKIIQPRLRIGIAFFLTLILYPLAMANPGFFWMVIMEVAVGVTIGYFTMFIFAAVSFAGSLIDTDMGFAMVSMADPIDEDIMSTATGVLMTIIFTILFLLFNGHYYLLMALQKSFELIPVGRAAFPSEPVMQAAVNSVTLVMEIGIRLAAPIMVALFITSVALGVIAKTMPQMNIFFVGAPLKIAVGFLTLSAALPGMVKLFEWCVQRMYQDVWALLKIMAVT